MVRGHTISLETSARSRDTEALEGEEEKQEVLFELKGFTLQSHGLQSREP